MVNQQFTFAVHIMALLAFNRQQMDSQALARSVNTNPVVVRRLLLGLRRAGLVETFAGKNGGARLAKPAGEISLRAIYDAIEARPVIAVNKRRAWRHCPVSCQMKTIMTSLSQKAEEAMRSHLEAVTLKKLVRQIEP